VAKSNVDTESARGKPEPDAERGAKSSKYTTLGRFRGRPAGSGDGTERQICLKWSSAMAKITCLWTDGVEDDSRWVMIEAAVATTLRPAPHIRRQRSTSSKYAG
jgi:hypothetical protein